MHLRSLIREAFAGLKRDALRSVLTILGIAVGIGAFICVVAIGNAGSARVEDQLQSLGDNFVWIEAGSRAVNGVRMGARGTRSLIEADADAILQQVPHIKLMSPNVDGHQQVVYGNTNWSTQYRGVTPAFLEIRRWTVQSGNFFTDDDVRTNAMVCVLGNTVATNLFEHGESPIDQVVRVKDLPCRVVGVLAAKGFSATGQDQDDFIVMPISTVQKRITGQFWLDDIFVSAESREVMPVVTQDIIGLLRERHHLHPGEPEDFNIRTPEELIKAQLAASEAMKFFLATVASLSLVVGGVGIMNIMLVSVTQRTREIGVRLAVGATEQDVQLQFLGEATVLALLGGVVGLLVGFFSSGLVESVFHFPTKLTIGVFVVSALFSAAVGIVFGFYPARRASQLDPIQGLRYE
jgi:putative ABC transport system permease protein